VALDPPSSDSGIVVLKLKSRSTRTHGYATRAFFNFFAPNVTHNAGSQRSRNSLNARRSLPDVVFGKVHKYNILWLTGLTKASEFHLYYDI
jgi:hypothetical protein